MAEAVTNGDKKTEGSFVAGSKVTSQLLKTKSGEFDLESIFILNLRQHDIDDLGIIGLCTCLQKLDLSRNDLTDLGGLIPLKQLVSLNIAANRITNLGPLKELESLKSLNASGNLIKSFDSIFCLSVLKNLEDLRFQDSILGWANPVCNNSDYRNKMTSHFYELKTLDGERICGKGSEVFLALRQMDRSIAKCDETSSALSTKHSTPWVEKGFWDLDGGNTKEMSDISDAETKLKALLKECRSLNSQALQKIDAS